MTMPKLLQAPPLTDFEAATAKVIGPDAVDAARVLQGRFRVYEVDEETAKAIIETNAKVHTRRYAHEPDNVPGVCYIDELPCGCVFENDKPAGERTATFQLCQEHAEPHAWCCEASVAYPCRCKAAQWCVEHGDQHGNASAHLT